MVFCDVVPTLSVEEGLKFVSIVIILFSHNRFTYHHSLNKVRSINNLLYYLSMGKTTHSVVLLHCFLELTFVLVIKIHKNTKLTKVTRHLQGRIGIIVHYTLQSLPVHNISHYIYFYW